MHEVSVGGGGCTVGVSRVLILCYFIHIFVLCVFVNIHVIHCTHFTSHNFHNFPTCDNDVHVPCALNCK